MHEVASLHTSQQRRREEHRQFHLNAESPTRRRLPQHSNNINNNLTSLSGDENDRHILPTPGPSQYREVLVSPRRVLQAIRPQCIAEDDDIVSCDLYMLN